MRIPGIVSTMLLVFISCCNNNPVKSERFSVSLAIRGSGTVSGFPEDSTIERGDTLHLLAKAEVGSYFYGWSAGRLYTENPLSLTVTDTLSITALFAKEPASMVVIPAKDSQFTMGSSVALSDKMEQPAHSVKFTYDYYMGAAEVTTAEYREVMGENAIEATAQGDDSLPVSWCTWYDAVLYCNALSKREGYDTVYSYTARCATPGKCPYILENCTIHYNRFGYRLPTEAEWEYACRGRTETNYFWGDAAADAGLYAWSFENAHDSPQRGKQKRSNSFGLYDMSGNIAEWVNDWLTAYVDTLYIDPVGPLNLTHEQFANTYKRPIKGGSYRQSTTYLRPSVRRGGYDVSATAAQVDIGFRVALGTFNAPLNAPEKITVDSLNARIVINKSDLVAIAGTHQIKTVFAYRSNKNSYCAFVDFSESPVILRQCRSDDSNVVAPVFSPDGNFIAWGSNGEGTLGNSTISVRSVTDSFPLTDSFPGFFPRFWVDLTTNDTFLVYTDGAMGDDLPAWSTEKTYRWKIKGGVREGSAEIIWNQGSYHGGLSSDGRFLGTAYTAAKLVDLQLNDTNIFYFLPPWNGLTRKMQVCNLSMSPSRTKPGEALFLDFGTNFEVSSLVGRKYGFHEIIFVANPVLFSKEHIAAAYVVPSAYRQWNYSEYTNHPSYIAAVAEPFEDSDSAVSALYLINAADSTNRKVIEGVGIREVAIWIDPNKVSEIAGPYERFGEYGVPIQTAGHVVLAKKMRLFWHERNNAECVAIGNSPMLYGFDPRNITALPTLSIAWFSSCIGNSITIAQEYVLPHTSQLKVLIIDLDASYFSVDHRVLPRLTGLYYTLGYELDKKNNFYRDGVPAAVQQKIEQFTPADWESFDLKGALIDSSFGNNSWGVPLVEGRDYSFDDSIVKDNIALFEGLLDSTAARGVKLLAINFPQNPAYRDTTLVGKDGPTHATYQLLAERMNGYRQKYSHFYFYDANKGGEHDYTDAEARDANHLNSRGGAKLATRVDSLLQTILK